MKSARLILTLVIVLVLARRASALDQKPLCNAELVQSADLIVVGVAAKENGKMVIHVSEVLKGKHTELVALRGVTVDMGDVVIKEGHEGVYFLTKDGAGYAPFHFDSYKGMDHVKAVRAAIAILADPGPFLDVAKSPENVDTIYVLSAGFGRWSISSKEISSLQESWQGWRLYEEGPWDEKRVVTLQCATDASNGFTVGVASAEPKGALSECLKYRLLINYQWPTARQSLPPRFAVTLDARLPERVGSATAEKAMSYLRDRLSSADPEIVLAALLALAKMRDRDAVPHVLSLLEHKDERVRIKAIEFLGWSRDERTVKPLHSLLDAKAPHYHKYYAISDSAARSLEQIGSAESLPHLERAACYGVERAANAVCALGRQESFEIMLNGLRDNPPQCSSIDTACTGLYADPIGVQNLGCMTKKRQRQPPASREFPNGSPGGLKTRRNSKLSSRWNKR